MNSLPSWNFTSWRRVNTQVFGSGLLHAVASSGSFWLSTSLNAMSGSKTCIHMPYVGLALSP